MSKRQPLRGVAVTSRGGAPPPQNPGPADCHQATTPSARHKAAARDAMSAPSGCKGKVKREAAGLGSEPERLE
eukprot:CAMPEP_0179049174 /NCGR_PEP_ID=MMETSP0796-20121207/20078_1 /TAXON_ID=73915 /ORGANISM="Pyrodinium bahamense, Strain pbaha01" /LENGTH=72 /DNA_ID=CAMNT_0020745645 /DNA_START=10 /DNA_END=226 /DNA_ORIENTATION=+